MTGNEHLDAIEQLARTCAELVQPGSDRRAAARRGQTRAELQRVKAEGARYVAGAALDA